MDEAFTTSVAALLAGLAIVVTATAVVATLRRRTALRRELQVSREEVNRLAAQVERLTERVDTDRAEAYRLRQQDREYVITSLTDNDPTVRGPVPDPAADGGYAPGAGRRVRRVPDPPSVVAARLEERLLQVIAQERRHAGLRAGAADVAVRVLALGAGLQHAMSPDVRDRAAAEARVASRRSRRERKRELREAQRLLRSAQRRSRESFSDAMTSADEGVA